MKTYQASVTREGQFWVAVVEGLRGGATETRTLAALEGEVRDLVSGLTGSGPGALDLAMDYTSALPKAAGAAVANLKRGGRS